MFTNLCAYLELHPSLAGLPVDLLMLQVGLLPLAIVLVRECHNIGLVALLACRAKARQLAYLTLSTYLSGECRYIDTVLIVHRYR